MTSISCNLTEPHIAIPDAALTFTLKRREAACGTNLEQPEKILIYCTLVYNSDIEAFFNIIGEI